MIFQKLISNETHSAHSTLEFYSCEELHLCVHWFPSKRVSYYENLLTVLVKLCYQMMEEAEAVHNDLDSEIVAYTNAVVKIDCKKKMTLRKTAGKKHLS